ncbi:MAG: CBS domain-containing protein [Acidobacteria bacterium]|nr:CBS domain-containing protein [Acidobacteriota bacterium]MBI3278426.1 CBS domain-containing protein [Acidobacteriota bacterium]
MVPDNVLYCTELVGLAVFDTRGRKIGRIKDAAVVPLIDPTRVDRFLIGGGWSWLTFRHDQVDSISLKGIYLREEHLTPYHSDEYMLRILRDLLDQQIIDAQGRKVVRVTDVTFEIRKQNGHDTIHILEVDIGIRSIVRRLLQGAAPPAIMRRLQAPIPPKSIPWQFCNIVESDPQRRLRLNISNDALERMHPADLADIVEELSPEDREAIIETIDAEIAADALSEMDRDVQSSILESLEAEKAAEIIEEMAADEAAHALAELEEETSHEILEELTPESKSEVSELIDYGEDRAGFLMNPEFVALPQNATVREAVATLRGNEEQLETLNTIFLLDREGRLKASVPLARLFVAPEDAALSSFAAEALISVSADERQDRVTELFDKYNVLTLPVLDDDGRLAGVITADDIISVLRHR